LDKCGGGFIHFFSQTREFLKNLLDEARRAELDDGVWQALPDPINP
jgi:hypothetical protein